MGLVGALITLQEKLPRFGGSSGPRPSRRALKVLLVVFGFLTAFSTVYILRHAGAPEALYRYPGLPSLSFSLTWATMLATELLRGEGSREDRFTGRRLASAVLAVVAWFVLIPALLLLGAAHLYATSGTAGVLGWAAFLVFAAGLAWIVGRYSGPVRRGSGR